MTTLIVITLSVVALVAITVGVDVLHERVNRARKPAPEGEGRNAMATFLDAAERGDERRADVLLRHVMRVLRRGGQ